MVEERIKEEVFSDNEDEEGASRVEIYIGENSIKEEMKWGDEEANLIEENVFLAAPIKFEYPLDNYVDESNKDKSPSPKPTLSVGEVEPMVPSTHEKMGYNDENKIQHSENGSTFSDSGSVQNSKPAHSIKVEEILTLHKEDHRYQRSLTEKEVQGIFTQPPQRVTSVQPNSNMSLQDCIEPKLTKKASLHKSDLQSNLHHKHKNTFSQKCLKNPHATMLHNGAKLFQCDVSKQGFTGESILMRHQEKHTEKKPFQCNDCEGVFRHKIILKKHQRILAEEKPFKCNECQKQFSYSKNLNQHLMIHTQLKPFQCIDCDRMFKQNRSLKEHQRIHMGEMPFKCNDCDKMFTRKRSLKVHQRIHTGEFKCKDCDRMFTQNINLKDHQRIHTGEKPFKCNDCDRMFTQKSNLTKHKKIHTGEKPFKCNDCDKMFMQKRQLKQHQRVHTGEKPFKCNDCDRMFTQSSNLKCHLMIHTGEKPFKCNECQKHFALKSYLIKHQKSVHT